MKRIKLEVAYNGAFYCGWQIQPNGVTIEEKLNQSLSKLLGEKIQIIGASRTDSGVHALGNVAVFDTNTSIPAERICYALNQILPNDIRVQNSCEVDINFHPRYSSSKKTYQYKLYNEKIEIPTLCIDSYLVSFQLDIEKMREAAIYLKGEHDFKSFCNIRGGTETTVRTIYEIELEKQGNFIYFTITGSGFLYHMVRIIVGTLIKVGRGVYPPEKMRMILEARDRSAAGPTIPGKGLTLVKIEYKESKK